jgi:hypothetical protein
MSLLLGVQKVELVGSEDWWTHNSSAVILAVAAIVAAAIAAFFAIRNQREQLAHDRYLRNQDHIRDTIDAALVSANEVRNTVERVVASIEVIEEIRDEGRETSPAITEKAGTFREETMTKLQDMRAAQVRLETRLGEEHLIATSHWEALAAYNTLFQKAHGGIAGPRETSLREGDEEREDAARQAFEEFQGACHQWLSSSGQDRSRGGPWGRVRRMTHRADPSDH